MSDDVRVAILDRLRPGDSAARGLLTALLTGNRRWISEADREAFRRTGNAHLLAISGLHIGFLAALLWWIVRVVWCRVPALARRIAADRAAALAAMLPPWAFVAVTGGAPSAVRAAVASSAWLLGGVTRRRPHAPTSLALAAFALCLADPAAWARPGAQLSFAAVIGILALGAPAQRWLLAEPDRLFPVARTPWTALERIARRAAGLLLIATAAQLATAPLALHHFGRVALLGPVVGLLTVPLALAAVALGTLWLLTASVASLVAAPEVAEPIARLAALTGDALLVVVRTADDSPSLSAGVEARPSTLVVLTIYALAFAGVVAWRRRSRRLAVTVALCAVAAGLIGVAQPDLGDGQTAARPLTVSVLNVGHGDAILLRFPDGRAALIDTPGPRGPRGTSAAARRVQRALRRRGVDRLAWLAASHPDGDHAGGLHQILRTVKVGVLWTSGAAGGLGWRSLLAEARRRGIPVRRPPARARFGGAELRTLWPWVRTAGPTTAAASIRTLPTWSSNHGSLVFQLDYAGHTVLLTGDLDARGEAALLAARGRRRLARVSVLKLGHHGSQTSSRLPWLARLSPRLAIVSAPAPRRRTRFPDPRVRRRLARLGIPLAWTGRDGDIDVEISSLGIHLIRSRGAEKWLTNH